MKKKNNTKSNNLEYYIGYSPVILIFLLITNTILLIYSPGVSSFIEPNEHKYGGFTPLPTMPVEELKEHLNLYIYKTVDGEILTEYSDDVLYNKMYRVTCSKKCNFSTYKVPFNISKKYVIVEEGTNTNVYDYINNKLVKTFTGANAILVEENLVLEHSNSYALYDLENGKYTSEYIFDSVKINPFYNDERKINIFTNHLVASKNNKYGIVNSKNGYEVTDFIYDDITCFNTTNYEYCKCKINNKYDAYFYNKYNTSITKLSNSYNEIYPVINEKYAYALINNKLVLISLPIEAVITEFEQVDVNNTVLYTSVKDGNPYIKFKKIVGRNTECTEYVYNLSTKSKNSSRVSCE